MQKKNDLFVFTKMKDLTKYIITITEKSPKKFRFTLVVRLQNYALDAVEQIYLANLEKDIKKRLEIQDKARATINLLDYIAQIAFEEQCILKKQYEQISLQVAEVLLYLGKWKASTKKSVSTTDN